MSEHRPEVADVIRIDGAAYLKRYRPSKEQFRVLNALSECRTAALGACRKRCEQCGHEVTVYCSCRNRHCPKCQGAARAAWLEAREREVLDVEYFHVVFTLPHELAPLALQNRRAVYGMLFRAASETLVTIARDPKHLGAEIGCLALLRPFSVSDSYLSSIEVDILHPETAGFEHAKSGSVHKGGSQRGYALEPAEDGGGRSSATLQRSH